MAVDLFFSWLKRSDEYIARTSARRDILLLENFSAHGTYCSLPALSNVEVHFLPPNTASCIQPLNAEFIAALKAAYRRRLSFRIFDKIDASAKTIHDVDILMVMRRAQEEWELFSVSTISNCWDHCLGERNFTKLPAVAISQDL